MSKNRRKGSHRTSAAHHENDDSDFILSLISAFDDKEVMRKLARVLRTAKQELVSHIDDLKGEVRALRASLAERDEKIEALNQEVRQLRDNSDALEQYGRRSSLRISGIPEEEEEDSTAVVVSLANEVLELDPPLQPTDIDISHRLRKPRNARQGIPAPIIVRFMTRKDRYRVISERKKLKNYNEDKQIKVYINEDLTTTKAQLFAKVRKLHKNQFFKQVWTFNGNVKVTDLQGHVKSINNLDDAQKCLPNINISNYLWTYLNDVLHWLFSSHFL